VHCAFIPPTPLSWGLGVQGWSHKECKAFTMSLGWSFSWSFCQVNKFMSLLSSSFSHFLHCCVWSSLSHLLAVLCVVVFPPFHGDWCVRIELQGMWNTCNIMKLIVLMVFFCSPHCHCLFWVISHVNVHGHLLIIILHYCALRSCSPFLWGLGV
jgi:hypothetical protein